MVRSVDVQQLIELGWEVAEPVVQVMALHNEVVFPTNAALQANKARVAEWVAEQPIAGRRVALWSPPVPVPIADTAEHAGALKAITQVDVRIFAVRGEGQKQRTVPFPHGRLLGAAEGMWEEYSAWRRACARKSAPRAQANVLLVVEEDGRWHSVYWTTCPNVRFRQPHEKGYTYVHHPMNTFARLREVLGNTPRGSFSPFDIRDFEARGEVVSLENKKCLACRRALEKGERVMYMADHRPTRRGRVRLGRVCGGCAPTLYEAWRAALERAVSVGAEGVRATVGAVHGASHHHAAAPVAGAASASTGA